MGNSQSGRGGLPREKQRQLERLIHSGMKNAHIARAMGIDVSTVSRYKRRMRRAAELLAAAGEPIAIEVGAETVRCGGCGGSIQVKGAVACLRCLLEKTVLAEERRKRVARIAGQRARRSQKARIAA
jgi:predicted transcriptional regulator